MESFGRITSPQPLLTRYLYRLLVPNFNQITFSTRKKRSCCSLSMNGCEGDSHKPLGLSETRKFPAVETHSVALTQLQLAISMLKSDPPPFTSGIIRIEVPIQQQIEAIGWLHAQHQLPRCYFSSRGDDFGSNHLFLDMRNENSVKISSNNLVSVAGIGSAVFFQRFHSFNINDWRCMKRFLPMDCPLIRAYGAMRFDPNARISSEWEGFGSFYFIIPQVEIDEFVGFSILSSTIAWDDTLSMTWKRAIDTVEDTLSLISPVSSNLRKDDPRTTILSKIHVPSKSCWDAAVSEALHLINKSNSKLVKVVLARSTKLVTQTDIDPLSLLAYLQAEGQNAYQFCIQPPSAPAFVGNTPEQLFRRNFLNISSEALAGTRARGGSQSIDFQIEHDLLHSPKDDHEFMVVQESIRRTLEGICEKVLVNSRKTIRKFPRVQHLYGQFSGKLRSEDDEFTLLSSLHPTPAVCGLPMEEAKRFISEIEMFDRGMYAGPVGWFGGTETEFCVGIRSALVQKGAGVLIYAGAGIVNGTESTLEWEELELKASQFTRLIGNAEEPFSSTKEYLIM